jgi:hypothetical protein
MDIYCPRCGEPYDQDELHYADDLTYDEARKVFFGQGCGMVYDGTPCPQADTPMGRASAAAYELLGSDVDGIAAEMDDVAYFGDMWHDG